MSDTSGAAPPPPPPNLPPPTYGAPAAAPQPNYKLPPGYHLPPNYQGPTAPDYAQPYQYQPGAPQSISPGAVAFGSASVIASQFGGYAAYSIVVGFLGIALPFFTPYYFRVLPIFGIITGARAIMRGRVLGGAVGIGVNLLAGLVSLAAAGLIGA